MDGELLKRLYHRLFDDPKLQSTYGCVFGDAVILLIHFLAVLTNHSPRWSHDQRNWPRWCRRLKFPSYSQLMKRLKDPCIQQHIEQLDREFRGQLPSGPQKICDGKPLVVGGYSKDKQATRGKVPDGWARGYKVHVLIDAVSGAFEALDVTGLDVGEPTTMRKIVQMLDLAGTTVRGDSNYDSNPLYETIAQRGGRLIAPRKKPGTGLGHGSADRSPHHPHRLLAIQELETDDTRLKEHKRERNGVEQRLAHLTNVPFGLWALPNHVRHLRRVRQWVRTKVMLYHLYLVHRRSMAEAA
jgi:Transposase DDE domain